MLKKKIGGAVVAMVPFAAFAEVPAAVTTELTAMKADGVTVAGLVLAAIIAIAAVKFIRKGL